MNTVNSSDIVKNFGNLISCYSLINNQTVAKFAAGELFYSYGHLIGAKIDGKYYFTGYHDYSKTTGKWTKVWSGIDTKSRRQGLEDGTYTYIDYTYDPYAC